MERPTPMLVKKEIEFQKNSNENESILAPINMDVVPNNAILYNNYHRNLEAEASPKDSVLILQNSNGTVLAEESPRLFEPSTWGRKQNLLFASILSVALVVGAALALFIVLLGSNSVSMPVGGGDPPPGILDPFLLNYTTEIFASLPSGSGPNGIRINKNGDIFAFLFGGNKIVKINENGFEDFAGSGSLGREDGIGTQASFFTPGSGVIDAGNNIFVSGLNCCLTLDASGNQLRKIDSAGRVTSTCQGLNSPFGLAIDNAGTIFVADNRTVSLNLENSRIAKCQEGIVSSAAPSSNPFGVAIDFAGNLYYTTGLQNSLVRLDVQNSYNPTALTLTINGAPVQLSNPNNLAFDKNGYLYIAERGRDLIRKVNVLTSDSYFIGEGLNFPSDVAVKDGIIYVADSNSDRILRLVPIL